MWAMERLLLPMAREASEANYCRALMSEVAEEIVSLSARSGAGPP
jgi:hypothetical protein